MENIPVRNIDLTYLTSEAYDNLIDEIRALFVIRADYTYRGVPVTTNEEGFHIISLDHDGYPSVLLVIDQKNGYLIGFRDSRGQWYRFSDQGAFPAHAEVIRHMTSSYFSLVDDWALVRLIIMLCEAVRLRTVRTLVSRRMALFTNAPIDPLTRKKIRSWSLMSGFAGHCWRREHDEINGYEQSELDKLAQCQVFSPEEVAGDPNGELMLILYSKVHFGGIE
ncbi:hypothetical protein BRADI_4g05801v3 [Brachypodium distachyon]|uniref:rRNA N-glycosylase n=1 Tax=Brachypodium distachyon TaxID=15368 RepID=A0A0Q3IJU3_BRADI|nr:hypothetical protein BRADI_4g05801v3 [Brachypodium distachyon]